MRANQRVGFSANDSGAYMPTQPENREPQSGSAAGPAGLLHPLCAISGVTGIGAAHFDAKTPALAVFSGPHAYVSARWYPSVRQVPTWNYVAVHATGTPRILNDPAHSFELLRSLMTEHEAGLPEAARGLGKGPRELADIPFAHQGKLLRGIVAFELPIERLEGKRKLSQNKKPAERLALIAGLRATGEASALAIAQLMEAAPDTEEPR